MISNISTLHALQFHAGMRSDWPEQLSDPGPRITQHFRPFTGSVDPAALERVADLARAASKAASSDDSLRVPCALAIWVLTETIERWALDCGGMLQRNHLVTESDQNIIRSWLSELHEIGCLLLEGHPDSVHTLE